MEAQTAIAMIPKAITTREIAFRTIFAPLAMANDSEAQSEPQQAALDEGVSRRKFPLVSRMKRYLPFIIVVGVALVTFGSGTMLYRAKRPRLRTALRARVSLQEAKPKAVRVIRRPLRGRVADFQCPPCG